MVLEPTWIPAGPAHQREARLFVPEPGPSMGPQPDPPLRAVVFVNPVAPNVDSERLDHALDASFGPGAWQKFATGSRESFLPDAERALAAAAANGCELAVVAGGDGTVSQIAERIHHLGGPVAGMTLAIVPCGTANVLARELGIPIAIEDAVALAANPARHVRLDGIAFEDRLFLTQVGIGLDAYMIRDTSRESLLRFKRLSYLTTLARRAVGHRSRSFRIRIDGRWLRVRAWQVLAANASTLGTRPFVWGPDIDPADGVIDLCVFEVRRVRDLAHLVWKAFTGNLHSSPHARFFRVRGKLRVETHRPLPVQGDGECVAHTPVELTVVPDAVRVVAGPLDEAPATPPAKGVPPSAPPDTATRGSRWQRARRRIGAADTGLYLAINRMEGGTLVDRLLGLTSRALDWGELWILVSLLAAWRDPDRLGRIPLVVIPALWATMLTVNFPIKGLFGRRRPFLVHEKARLRGRKPTDSSFPSGHTAAAFAGAALLTPHLPALSPLLWTYALAVAFSRVYLGVHFPADVVVGGVLGAVLAGLYGGLIGLLLPGS